MDFVYEGRQRRMISFPLGGIGSGCIGLSGYGQLIDWEIFNRPNKGSTNGFSHFGIKAEREGRVLDARVLHADIDQGLCGSLTDGFGSGQHRHTLMGFPHFRDCGFEGKFPIAKIVFSDTAFPGVVSLEAFNPLIPTNEDDSSIPAAFFTLSVENNTAEEIAYTFAASLNNPFKGNNRYERREGVHLLHMTDPFHDPEDYEYGDMTLATDGDDIAFQESWFKGAWFDNIGIFWRDFTSFGKLKNRRLDGDGKMEQVGTLESRIVVSPGEKKSVRFIISWNMPNNHNYWASPQELAGGPENRWKNYYAVLFHDSSESAVYGLSHWDRLYGDTCCYQKALFSSTLPKEALDAAASTVSVLKSPTVLRLEDGSLYGWEGCWAHEGSCEGSCTHVWAYTYALCYLFPRLERSMREIEFRYDSKPDGGLGFRVKLPLGREPSGFRPCADGQFATVFKTLREYRICGDNEWLRRQWPEVKKALEYAWSPENYDRWDPEASGVLTGRQHHTLDMELFGPNSWLESMYLCALKAAAAMAETVGDEAAGKRYAEIYEKGKEWSENHLFNGEYFCQKIDLKDKNLLEKYPKGEALGGKSVREAYWDDELGEMKYQIAEGCAIDQVLGQWHANMIGLGEIFEKEKVRAALEAVYRYNYQKDFRSHINPCRLFGVNDESGTLICAYPPGRIKPQISVPYAEETMHGFEYQAAVHMIQEGMVEEGMTLIKAVRDRYDGEKRNPWNEMECGSNYARSMAAFAVLPAFSGMSADMGKGALGFSPIPEGDFSSLWSLDSGFGTIEFREGKAFLRILYGSLKLKTLSLKKGSHLSRASVNGKPIAPFFEEERLKFQEEIYLRAGDCLTAE